MLGVISIAVICSGALAGAVTLAVGGYFLCRKVKELYGKWKLRPVGPIRCDSPIWRGEIYYPVDDEKNLV